MIGYIAGTVISVQEKSIIIDTGNIGYKVFVSPSLLTQTGIGDVVQLWIYSSVREDAFDLFGFTTQLDQEVFELLLNVSGIGPKSALGILSVADMSSLVHAIKTENVTYLTQVSGIGKKTAEKIVLELKDKVEKIAIVTDTQEPDHLRDVIDALLAMGYHEKVIREALRVPEISGLTNTSEIIRESLKFLGK